MAQPQQNDVFARLNELNDVLDEIKEKMNPPKLQNISPPHFKGRDDPKDFEQFVKEYCRVGDALGWTEEILAKSLPSCLEGEALAIYEMLDEDERDTWENIKTNLTQKFSQDSDAETLARLQIAGRKQKFGESVAEYGHAIEQLVRKAYPTAKNYTPVQRQSIAVDSFIQGLKKELKEVLCRQVKPATLADAINNAQKEEFHLRLFADENEKETKQARLEKEYIRISKEVEQLKTQLAENKKETINAIVPSAPPPIHPQNNIPPNFQHPYWPPPNNYRPYWSPHQNWPPRRRPPPYFQRNRNRFGQNSNRNSGQQEQKEPNPTNPPNSTNSTNLRGRIFPHNRPSRGRAGYPIMPYMFSLITILSFFTLISANKICGEIKLNCDNKIEVNVAKCSKQNITECYIYDFNAYNLPDDEGKIRRNVVNKGEMERQKSNMKLNKEECDELIRPKIIPILMNEISTWNFNEKYPGDRLCPEKYVEYNLFWGKSFSEDGIHLTSGVFGLDSCPINPNFCQIGNYIYSWTIPSELPNYELMK
jgi:hypothetical protein